MGKYAIVKDLKRKTYTLSSYISNKAAREHKSDSAIQSYLSVFNRINFQIKSLSTFLIAAKELSSKANQSSHVLSEFFQKENLKKFAHLDSPFKLIRFLAKSSYSAR